MNGWWSGLTQLNQIFFGLAVLFSIPFVWQLVSALVGLGDHDVHDGIDGQDVDTGDADATVFAFKLFSLRAILTFFTLFFWAAALALEDKRSLPEAIQRGFIWGILGFILVGTLLHFLPKLAHTGTRDLATAIDTEGTVYVDIPDNGEGEVRALVNGSISYIKARTVDGKGLKSGTPVVVRNRVGQTILIVEAQKNKV